MSRVLGSWVPAGVLLLGVALNGAIGSGQRVMPLRAPLAAAIPASWNGYRARDVAIPAEEADGAGMTDYTLRVFEPEAAGAAAPFSVFVSYYSHQERGRSIHSPRNCLPGSGWEPLHFQEAVVTTALGAATVNRYLIRRGEEHAVVLYWYQGRGRVASDELAVKWELLRDRALHQRSDEALVRVIVPFTDDERAADRFALQVAERLLPAVARAVPG
jgi:EpsI family protein